VLSFADTRHHEEDSKMPALGYRLSTKRTISAGGSTGSIDSDAQSIISAVEAADGQSLETSVKNAINTFVVGAKDGGIWDDLDAGVWRLMAGPRTLAGALANGRGANPTNNGFVSGDYVRAAGIKGDGSSKYLDANYNTSQVDSGDFALSTYLNTAPVSGEVEISANTSGNTSCSLFARSSGTSMNTRAYNNSIRLSSSGLSVGNPGFYFVGKSTINVVNFFSTEVSSVDSHVQTSDPSIPARDFYVLARNSSETPGNFISGRMAFYGITEYADPTVLEPLVDAYLSAIEASGVSPYDLDAQRIIDAVETADGEALENSVKNAIDALIKTWKSEGIYTTIAAGQWRITGPRTLAGSLKNGQGADPINVGLVAGDYSRSTGWKGNGTDKSFTLSNNNTETQNDAHRSVWVTTSQVTTPGAGYMGMSGSLNQPGSSLIYANTNTNAVTARSMPFSTGLANVDHPTALVSTTGYIGTDRSTSENFQFRASSATATSVQASGTPRNEAMSLLKSNTLFSDGRIAAFVKCASLGAAGLLALETSISTYLSAISGI
jgi:hypothetical protein